MRRRETSLFLAVLFLCAGSAQAYRPVIDLGTLGGELSRALSINNSGQIVGDAYNSSGRPHACLFDTTGGGDNTDLENTGLYYGSLARCISNNGQIVGWVDSHACLFDPTGGAANIILYHGDNISQASSINNNGLIVGSITNDIFNTSTATLFDPTGGGNNIPLGTWGGWVTDGFSNSALAINDSNVVVGRQVFTKQLFGQTVTYNAASRYEDLSIWGTGLPLDDDTSCARFINNSGQIVGWAENSSGSQRACLFDPTGGGNNTSLGTISGYNSSGARCINDDGRIVGEVFAVPIGLPPIPTISRACLFDPTGEGNNINLNTPHRPFLRLDIRVRI